MSNDDDEDPPASEKTIQLPIDVLLRVLGFISDRKLWFKFSIMNKDIYKGSRLIPMKQWPQSAALYKRYHFSNGCDKMAFSGDGQALYYAFQQGDWTEGDQMELHLWSARSGQHHFYEIGSFGESAFSPDGRTLALYCDGVEGRSPIVQLLHLGSNPLSVKKPSKAMVLSPDFEADHLFFTLQLDFSPNGKMLAACYKPVEEDKLCLCIWDVKSKKIVKSTLIPSLQSSQVSTKLNCFNKFLLWRASDGSQHIWNFTASRRHSVPLQSCPKMFPLCHGSIKICTANPRKSSIVAFLSKASNRGSVVRAGALELEPSKLWRPDEVSINQRKGLAMSYNEAHFKLGFQIDWPETLVWFPDGIHIAFVDKSLRGISLFRVDLKTLGFKKPSGDSRAARLVTKANEVILEQCRNVRLGERNYEIVSRYLAWFKLSPDGKSLVFHVVADDEDTAEEDFQGSFVVSI